RAKPTEALNHGPRGVCVMEPAATARPTRTTETLAETFPAFLVNPASGSFACEAEVSPGCDSARLIFPSGGRPRGGEDPLRQRAFREVLSSAAAPRGAWGAQDKGGVNEPGH